MKRFLTWLYQALYGAEYTSVQCHYCARRFDVFHTGEILSSNGWPPMPQLKLPLMPPQAGLGWATRTNHSVCFIASYLCQLDLFHSFV
jgi:hypothetical protein